MVEKVAIEVEGSTGKADGASLHAVSGRTDLSIYKNSWFNPGRGVVVRLLWYFVNALFFLNPLNPFIGLKVALLRAFGAKIGKGVVIKPAVNIKYPWNIEIGNYSWIGEKVWIDNLALVTIGNNCCISQGAMLLCGNHNYRKPTFDLIARKIVVEDGAWIGAMAVVVPGVKCGSHCLLMVSSVAVSNMDAYGIYQGNPAVKVRDRIIS